jgi:outer membrane protein OmpA-like peptidoglycan-associated protein
MQMAKPTSIRRLLAQTLIGLSLTAMSVPAALSDELTEQQIVAGLQGLSAKAPAIDTALLAQQALAHVGKAPGTPLSPDWTALTKLPQLSVDVNFEYDSIAIVPESYRALGLMADALHHPLLLGSKFLIVGHTDSTGKAKYNITLSQKRADAIAEILSTTFGVPAKELFTVGVGSELPLDPSKPDAAINRRVQLINIGRAQ